MRKRPAFKGFVGEHDPALPAGAMRTDVTLCHKCGRNHCESEKTLYNAGRAVSNNPERRSGLMLIETKLRSNRAGSSVRMVIVTLVLLIFGAEVHAQDQEIANKLQGFDSYMEQTLKDWNTPGIGVGIVINDKLVFAKGYGYRDYEKKLPFTPTTLCQIASNSKLFT